MKRLERLYAINEELKRRAPFPVSAPTLADQFEVNRRTIERDLSALRSAGVPIDGDVGRTGGYSLAPTKGNVVFTLTPEEVVALLLATRAAAGMPFTSAATTATRRLLDALPDATRVQVDELRDRIRASESSAQRSRPVVRRVVRRAVETAVRDHVVVKLRYVDADGVTTTRAVEAHGFYGAVDGWYLVGWCRLREGGRIFRLDRIAHATVTTEQAVDRDLDEVLGWVPHDVSRP
jgi:predicted DNA-binding transcriptional regulator YafY